jgi:FixJ family two-component response regulator
MTVLDKPLDEDEVWNAIRRGLIQSESTRQKWTKHAELDRRFSSLSDNEAKVADLIVQGKTNRQIAEGHRVSIRTIEARRQKTYSKLGVSSLPELVEVTIEHRSYKRDDRHNPASIRAPTRIPAVNMQVETIGVD